MVSLFILHCFSLSLTDYLRGEKSRKWCDKFLWFLLISGQMQVIMIISEPAIKIVKRNVNIAV